ncbi:class I SAM-dependent methyltransferase [Pedococcus sp. 5OH_020]|uniref:class I SAM-dependent methyltransferase n=1 Tax=Pedococcus sp. 5OH_020 TaxID=2989814 RepID=UPI0022E9E5C2|nr:class I SAM-dependent methyltransferase [Pedococcus sp. 5OH_020]
MTTATARLAGRPAVDPRHWPHLAVPSHSVRRALQAQLAQTLFRSIVRRLPMRAELAERELIGGGAHDSSAPVMRLRRPEAFFGAVGADGLIGFGESYMAGDWDSPDLGRLLGVFAAQLPTLVPAPLQRLRSLYVARHPRSERNTSTNTRSNIARHYDLSNDLFATFLDSTLSYSAALFDGLSTIGEPLAGESVTVSRPAQPQSWDVLSRAQEHKIERILDAARVGEGTRLLEIGTGWGALAVSAARRGASVLTVTLSSEQQALARERVSAAGLSDRVSVELLDYRAVEGRFDSIVSVEMVEAVGHDYWPEYFRTLERALAPGGTVALQAITMPHERMVATRETYTWINKYIFPGGFLPSTQAIIDVTRDHTTLRLVDRLSFGQHYAETLRLWDERFVASLDRVHALGFDEVFARMWHFYLEYSRAGFTSGYLDVQQLVLRRAEGAT